MRCRGLKLDVNTQVIGTNWRPIPGVFTCGEMVGGLFHFIPIAEAEAEVEPHSVADDLGGEPMTLVWVDYR
jgi:hypothetical protein